MDCTANGQNQALLSKYGVRGFPTILFLDPKGEVVDRLGARDAQSVIQKIEAVVAQHSTGGAGGDAGGGGLDEVVKQALEEEKLIGVLFVDPKKAEKQEELQAALDADGLAELKGRFLWVEQPVKLEDGKRNPLARTLGVSSGPYFVLLDPRGEGELDKKKVVGKTNSVKKLQETLEGALEKADGK